MLSDMVNDDSGWSLSVPDAATPSGHGSVVPRQDSRCPLAGQATLRSWFPAGRPRRRAATEHSIAITSPPSLPITGTAILRHRSIAGDGSSPTWRSDCLDRDAVGVGSEGFDVRSVAGEDGAAGFGEGDDDRVDC